MNHHRKLIKTALLSRLALTSIQILSNYLIPDHDAKVFLYPKPPLQQNIWDRFVQFLFAGFVRWDGQYFMHIALNGYTYENVLAFFPLLPIVIKPISYSLSLMLSFLNVESVTIVSFTLFNVIIFVKATLCLYELTSVFYDKNFAYRTAVLFCFNPASIFFVAPYTECLFSYLTFKSMLNALLLYKRATYSIDDFVYLLPFALNNIVRSNGIINLGFLVYFGISRLLKSTMQKWVFTKTIAFSMFGTMFCLIPFVFYQMYAYSLFCNDFNTILPDYIIEYGIKNHYVMPGSHSKHNQTWCFKFPYFSYGYIQKHYWNVGFLKYYELKQIPNFLLAAPIIFVMLANTIKFVEKNKKRFTSTFGVFKFDLPVSKMGGSDEIVVFVVHALFLTGFCIFFVHIQVSTRMICSASPVLYWFCSGYFNNVNNEWFLFSSDLNLYQNLIRCYFLGYFIIGTIIFCNFLPWT